MTDSIALRPATYEDLSLLRYWDEQPHIIACDPDDDWQWDTELQREPEWREQLVAEVNNCPIGFVQIIDPAREDSHYWGEVAENLRAIDIWIGEKDYLGQGYGTQMMEQALDLCFQNPSVTAVLVDPLASNVRAHKFYQRLGFKFVERRWFDKHDCFIYQLSRKDWYGDRNISS